MIDILALGEILIDFTENGDSSQGNKTFEANPGGAPANVLSAVSKWGKRAALIAKVGDDGFGSILLNALSDSLIDTSYMVKTKDALTTLAFVQTLDGGERSFSFYRDRTADVMLTLDDISLDAIKESRIIHFGSVSLSSEPAREATHYFVEKAKEMGKFITFDPNYRPLLWKDAEEAKKEVRWGLGASNLLKIADNEIEWLLDRSDYEEAAKSLLDEYPNIEGICVTLGKDGSMLVTRGGVIKAETFLDIRPIEKTGAGDTFFGTFLLSLLDNNLALPKGCDAYNALMRANAAASIITTRKGALKVMPTPSEVEKLLASKN